MDFLLIYFIGAIITLILANSQMRGPGTFTAALFIAAIWPLAFILKLILFSEKRGK